MNKIFDNKIKKNSFFAKIFKVKGGNDFKNNKKDLIEYSNTVSEEKEKREGSSEYTSPGIKKDNETGWQSALQKLSLGRYTSQGVQSEPVLKTNLIKGEVVTFIDWKRNIKILFIYIFLSLFVLGMLFVGLLYWEIKTNQRETIIQGKINEMHSKILRMNTEVEVVDRFQRQMNLVTGLLGRHVYWTNFFAFLEKNTLAEIEYLGGFSGGTDGSYSFALESDSFEAISRQVQIFRGHEMVKNVTVLRGTRRIAPGENEGMVIEKVAFNMVLALDPKIFYK